jgi:hypothetical protein
VVTVVTVVTLVRHGVLAGGLRELARSFQPTGLPGGMRGPKALGGAYDWVQSPMNRPPTVRGADGV